jgi:NADPH:quinone reductase-like Zn-dependent oxidoreductase
MHAAVVHAFAHPPQYGEIAAPEAGPGEVVVDMLAAGLHPRVRTGASGAHYTSDGVLPMIPGFDGVGRLPDGRAVFFVAPATMAERAVVNPDVAVTLPDGADPVAIAAAMNPAMSSWLAMRRRAQFEPGQHVLVLGATGNAGRMAVQIAKLLGAGQVIAAGRDPGRLEALSGAGADQLVPLTGAESWAEVGAAAADVDVVIDYLWGEVAAGVMVELVRRRAQAAHRLAWVEIGAMAGQTLLLPSAALRSTNLALLGSGQGSVSAGDVAAELPGLIDAVAAGSITVDAIRVPLADIEATWTAPEDPGRRVVFTIGAAG